jgi:hypothetical protein
MKREQHERRGERCVVGNPTQRSLEGLRAPEIIGELSNPLLETVPASLVASVRSRLRCMAVTQRSEFASIIERSGGQLRGLIAMMREKTASAVH